MPNHDLDATQTVWVFVYLLPASLAPSLHCSLTSELSLSGYATDTLRLVYHIALLSS